MGLGVPAAPKEHGVALARLPACVFLTAVHFSARDVAYRYKGVGREVVVILPSNLTTVHKRFTITCHRNYTLYSHIPAHTYPNKADHVRSSKSVHTVYTTVGVPTIAFLNAFRSIHAVE